MSDSAPLEPGPAPDAAAKAVMSAGLFILSEPGGEQAEAVSALRTSLMAGAIKQGMRSLALCGTAAGMGVSALTANLAVALAQAGMRTLLIDGDLHGNGLDGFFESGDDRPGLRQCLTGEVERLDDAICPDTFPDLALLRAGGTAANAQELLSGPALQNLVDHCLRHYDITLIDTPPANISADVRRIAATLGHALIVVRRDTAYLGDVIMLKKELEADRVNVIGSVLTG